jgi:cytochrome c oxidase subunit 4
MSHDHSQDHAHSHGEHGPDGHHISSQRTLITVLIVLLGLTALTVYAAKEIPVSQTAHIIIALIIASTKGAIVCLYFMHLLYDRIFYSAVFISCLFVFSLFIIFTVLDIGGRAQLDPVRAQLVRAVPTDMVAKARYDANELAGRELFMANCSVCHAADGSGVENLGKMLQGNEFIKTRSVDELVVFLQVGRPADHPMNERGVTMPARAGNPNLTDDQLRQIASWIKVMPNRQVGHGASGAHGGDHASDDGH